MVYEKQINPILSKIVHQWFDMDLIIL